MPVFSSPSPLPPFLCQPFLSSRKKRFHDGPREGRRIAGAGTSRCPPSALSIAAARRNARNSPPAGDVTHWPLSLPPVPWSLVPDCWTLVTPWVPDWMLSGRTDVRRIPGLRPEGTEGFSRRLQPPDRRGPPLFFCLVSPEGAAERGWPPPKGSFCRPFGAPRKKGGRRDPAAEAAG